MSRFYLKRPKSKKKILYSTDLFGTAPFEKKKSKLKHFILAFEAKSLTTYFPKLHFFLRIFRILCSSCLFILLASITNFEIISGNEVNQDEEEIDDDEEGAEAAEAENKTKDDDDEVISRVFFFKF